LPIFEYLCRDCNSKFEKLVLNSDNEVVCDNCQGRDLKKLFSTFAVPSNESNFLSDTMASGCSCTPTGCGCRQN
jgi:putative FmdB family regulatory protein